MFIKHWFKKCKLKRKGKALLSILDGNYKKNS